MRNYYNSNKAYDKKMYNKEEECGDNSYIVGNSVDFSIDECDSEIKADLTVTTRSSVRLWGQIKDCNGDPVPYACLKLIKNTNKGYVGVGHTMTDCLGFYQFDICPCVDGVDFRLLVSKASIGGYEKDVSANPNCKDVCDLDLECDCSDNSNSNCGCGYKEH